MKEDHAFLLLAERLLLSIRIFRLDISSAADVARGITFRGISGARARPGTHLQREREDDIHFREDGLAVGPVLVQARQGSLGSAACKTVRALIGRMSRSSPSLAGEIETKNKRGKEGARAISHRSAQTSEHLPEQRASPFPFRVEGALPSNGTAASAVASFASSGTEKRQIAGHTKKDNESWRIENIKKRARQSE